MYNNDYVGPQWPLFLYIKLHQCLKICEYLHMHPNNQDSLQSWSENIVTKDTNIKYILNP